MNESSPQGRFIAFEGGEGAGKSTQAKMLIAALEERGIASDLTREPGGTPGAEAIRTLLLDPPGEGWGAEAEALLFAAARSDHVATRIRPLTQAGKWVISDRFVDSSRAYQGGAGGLGDEAIQALHAFGSAGLRPDLTILLTLEPAIAAERLAARDGGVSDAIGGRSETYHIAVGQAFLSLANSDPEGFAVINASGDPEDVHLRIMQALNKFLPQGSAQ
ncbi:MAG: dTMP kinase [Pseudomonadota bacterium]